VNGGGSLSNGELQQQISCDDRVQLQLQAAQVKEVQGVVSAGKVSGYGGAYPS